MTHEVEGLCGGLFGGIELFEIFVGILVEGFDAPLTAKPDELAIVKGIDRFIHSAQLIVRDETGGEGVRLGQGGGLSFFLRSFGNFCLFRGGSGGFFGPGEGS